MPYSTSTNPFLAMFGGYFRPRVLRHLALYLALMLPMVWGLVAVEQARFAALAEAGSKSNLQNLARAFAEEVSATLAVVDLSLVQLRGTWRRAPDDFVKAEADHARYLRDRVPMWIAVTDATGHLLSTGTGTARTGMMLGDLPQFAVHRSRDGDLLAVGGPGHCRVTGRPALQITRPIRDTRGRLSGVIAASVPPAYFLRFYDSIDLGPDAAVSLVREDGTVVARSSRGGGNRDMGRVISNTPFLSSKANNGAYRSASKVDGVERFYAWQRLPEYGLIVTVGEAVRDAEARYVRQRAVMNSAGVAVSIGLALLGWAAIGAADRRRRALKALAAAEARWKLALNAAGDGVWDCDIKTGVATLSPSAQRILDSEHPAISWYGPDGMAELVHPDEIEAVRLALQAHALGQTPDYVYQHRIRLRSGDWRWIEARGTVTERGERGEPLRIVGTFSDIDARKLEEERMRRMAHEDPLTGLPNRALLDDRLREAIAAAQDAQGGDGDGDGEVHKVGLIYFDLDKFKPVNDTHGHAVGDRLLRMVAARVRGALRESDTLARVGGDEFVVLLPRCAQAADAERVAVTILAQLEQPFQDGELALHISGSLGYALYPDCGGDGEALLRCADLAMYDAKAHGRNRVSGSYRTTVE